MKVRLGSLALILSFLCPGLSVAQLETPASSPPATIMQRVGLTDITIRYSRPGVRDRRVFGELLPYDQIWRTGANEATRISFSRPVRIGEERIEAGTYALYSIPGERQWTWILNRDTSLWGDRGYDPARDRLRQTVAVENLPDRIETLDLRLVNLDFQKAELLLEWEYTRVRLPLSLDTDAQVDTQIARVLAGKPSGEDYYRAARYYLDTGRDLDKARQWIDKRVELDGEQFGILRYKALIEWETGDTATARRIMARSLVLARQAGNAHYVRMNEHSLREWTFQAAPLPADDILSRAIDYHDPAGAWAGGRLEWSLYESRPGSDYRLTDLLIDNATSTFQLSQQRGKNHLFRRLSPGECIVRLNGAADFSESDINTFRLRCADSEGIRNFYSFLWGLPMKLRDPGTLIDPDARLCDFFGAECYRIRVTYDPEVGKDVWYFYFDPATFALRGYRFYHNEDQNDGEYILLSREVMIGPLRIPARRDWYTNEHRLFLGTDEVIKAGTVLAGQ